MKKCFECETTEDLQEHHVVPKSRGGTKTVILCYECHMRAHGRDNKGLDHIKLTIEGLQKAKNEGVVLGKAPYGYKHSSDRKSYIELPEEQGAIKLVENCWENRIKWKGIVAMLNKEGYNTRGGKAWRYSTAYKVFNKRRMK